MAALRWTLALTMALGTVAAGAEGLAVGEWSVQDGAYKAASDGGALYCLTDQPYVTGEGSVEATVVAISSPLRAATVTGDRLNVEWTALGHRPASFTVLLDGRTVARGLQGTHATIGLHDVRSGPVTLRVVAEGTKMRYLPSWTEDSLPLDHPTTAYAAVGFTRER
jgi:hypothetical protein